MSDPSDELAATDASHDPPAPPVQDAVDGRHHAACCNCGDPLAGRYCARCGQRDLDLDRPLGELLADWLGAVVAFDSRLLRTLGPLLMRPGFLTREFLAGRRVRYVDPVKLYLAISLVATLLATLVVATLTG